MSTTTEDLRIEVVTNPEDFKGIFAVTAAAFGHQAKDALWLALFPDPDSPTTQQRAITDLTTRYNSITHNRAGDPNTIFLKATVPDPQNPNNGARRIAGMAVWVQASFVPGFGDPPSTELRRSDLEPLDPAEQRFAAQAFRSMWARRVQRTREKESASPPAIFVLDMCAVDPAFQKRGIASRLVQWGLEEARRRGGLECTTEASTMGRPVYMRLGMRPEEGRGDLPYEVDEEFRGRELPANVFLRTFDNE